MAKYFYENGNLEIGVKKDLDKAIEMLDDVSDILIQASEELIYIYYDLFVKSNKKNKMYFEKLIFYKEKCERNISFCEEIKKNIEDKLNGIAENIKPINIPLS